MGTNRSNTCFVVLLSIGSIGGAGRTFENASGRIGIFVLQFIMNSVMHDSRQQLIPIPIPIPTVEQGKCDIITFVIPIPAKKWNDSGIDSDSGISITDHDH